MRVAVRHSAGVKLAGPVPLEGHGGYSEILRTQSEVIRRGLNKGYHKRRREEEEYEGGKQPDIMERREMN